MAAHESESFRDVGGIVLDGEDDLFDAPENVTVGSIVPTGFPLKLAIGVAVLALALMAFMDDNK